MLRSFYKGGFERGGRLTDAGINVQELMDAGRLEMLPWTDMYVRDHQVRPGWDAGFSRNYRWPTAGESLFRPSRPVSRGTPQTTVSSHDRRIVNNSNDHGSFR